jgi:hypothetical protein
MAYLVTSECVPCNYRCAYLEPAGSLSIGDYLTELAGQYACKCIQRNHQQQASEVESEKSVAINWEEDLGQSSGSMDPY